MASRDELWRGILQLNRAEASLLCALDTLQKVEPNDPKMIADIEKQIEDIRRQALALELQYRDAK